MNIRPEFRSPRQISILLGGIVTLISVGASVQLGRPWWHGGALVIAGYVASFIHALLLDSRLLRRPKK